MTYAATEPTHLERYGARLMANGYDIVPIRAGMKHPAFDDWQSTVATPALLGKWQAARLPGGGRYAGVGILAKNTPGIDLDVRDQDVTDQLVAWVEARLGFTLQRVGWAPKLLIPCRADVPFTKVSSRKYADITGDEHKVEILGDGQQYVAYGIHPDTNRPYEWLGGVGLTDTPRSDLPLLSIDDARALVEYFEEIRPADWDVVAKKGDSGAVVSSDPVVAALGRAKPPLDITDDQIDAALAAIDPDMLMSDWVRVGMALHHQFDGHDHGFALWDAWSSGGVKYDQKEMRNRWKSFRASASASSVVTFATVLDMAGTVRREKIADALEPEDLLREFASATPADLDGFLERYVYVERDGAVWDLARKPTDAMLPIKNFREATANARHEVPDPIESDPDRVKIAPIHQAWLVCEARQTAVSTDYFPGMPRQFEHPDAPGLPRINVFHWPRFEDDEADRGDLAVFHAHTAYLFPCDSEREWFLNWLAFLLQKPSTRLGVTPLHIATTHGTGRGWLVQLIDELVGSWNATRSNMEALAADGGFNEYLFRTRFCAIEEVRTDRRYGVDDKVRSKLTDKTQLINIKNGYKGPARVFTNLFLMSNHWDALTITKEDRRIEVLTGPTTQQSGAYFDRLYAWLADRDNVAALNRWLRSRDIDGWHVGRASETPGRARMLAATTSDTDEFAHVLRATGRVALTWNQIMHAAEVVEGQAGSVVDEKQLRRVLRTSATQVGQLKFGGRHGTVRRPWVLDPSRADDAAEIRNSVEEYYLEHNVL